MIIRRNCLVDTLIQLLDENYELYDFRVKNSDIIMEIGSKINRFYCPYCGYPSERVHSHYQREIHDLPIQGKRAVLLVNTRKLFCDNPECQKKTFSERHPFAAVKGKKTSRLENAILNKSLDVSSVSASKLLASEGISISKSSICAMLKKNAGDCG